MGLNDSYQGVRSNILMMNPLSTLSQASSIVLQEEKQRELRPSVVQFDTDSAAFLSQQRYQSKNSTSQTVFSNFQSHHQQPHHQISTGSHSYTYPNLPKRVVQPQSSGIQCNYCKKPGHTIDKCYKLQRQRNDRGQHDRTRRVAASVQQSSITAEDTF